MEWCNGILNSIANTIKEETLATASFVVFIFLTISRESEPNGKEILPGKYILSTRVTAKITNVTVKIINVTAKITNVYFLVNVSYTERGSQY